MDETMIKDGAAEPAWLAQYASGQTSVQPRFGDGLSMFDAAVRAYQDAPAIHYFAIPIFPFHHYVIRYLLIRANKQVEQGSDRIRRRFGFQEPIFLYCHASQYSKIMVTQERKRFLKEKVPDTISSN